MKKIEVFLIFLIIGVLSFANKGNYDETKFRQDVINYAMANLGVPYSNDRRMQNGYYDCSSYVGRAVRAAGMSGGVNGNEGSWASTTDAMVGNVRKVSFDQIKPGDTLNFSKGPYKYGHTAIVLENLGNGKFKIAHAGNPTKIQTIDVNTWRKGTYIGSISATQILINNGYTPTNQSGQVVAPPAGSSVGTGTGSGQSTTPPSYIPKLQKEYDWDAISNHILGIIKRGVHNLFPDIKILLSIFFAFDLMYFFYRGFNGVNENFMIGFARKCLKFVFYLAVVDNYFKILEWAYEFFVSIGDHFYSRGILEIFSTSKGDSINKIANMGFKTILKFLGLINDWEHLGIFGLDVWGKLRTLGNLFTILVATSFAIYITARFIIEIYIAKIQFFLGSGLAGLFFPFDVFELTSPQLGNKAIRTIIATGLQLSVIVIIASISYEVLQSYTLGEINIRDKFELFDMFRFIIVNLIIVNLVAKGKNIVGYVMR